VNVSNTPTELTHAELDARQAGELCDRELEAVVGGGSKPNTTGGVRGPLRGPVRRPVPRPPVRRGPL
jgi:hypothetical protein